MMRPRSRPRDQEREQRQNIVPKWQCSVNYRLLVSIYSDKFDVRLLLYSGVHEHARLNRIVLVCEKSMALAQCQVAYIRQRSLTTAAVAQHEGLA